MGNYNPHAPYILGQEWVPIRDASYFPDQISERGYSFRLEHATPAVSGAVYVQAPTPKVSTNIAELVNVYPAGLENQSGPIRRVVIPVDNLGVTGSASGNAASVANPSDGDFLHFSASGTPFAELNFPIQNYSQQLFGKRILGVRLAYTAGVQNVADRDVIDIGIAMTSDILLKRAAWQEFIEAPVAFSTGLVLVTDLKYVDFGDTNILLTNPMTSSPSDPYDVSPLALPWRYQELLLFSTATTAGLRRSFYIDATAVLQGGVDFGYIALEVFYCEETRVRYGGRHSNGRAVTNASSFPLGPNFVQLVDTNFATPGALPAGEYVITHSHRELKPTFVARATPKLHALRQLYALPSHRGVELSTRVVEDSQFTDTRSDVLTQLTLHTASAIVTGVHPYGTRIGAPVYGTVTAIQEIEDDAAPVGGASYAQVRFYARRFGDTTMPLSLQTTSGTFTVSISVADFDALPNIVDGWREVTLRFTTAPTIDPASGPRDWRWVAAGETAGNQWQVLGADGPSPSGSQTIAPATYFAPVGDITELTWKSPNVSGSAEDDFSDAVLIFSQDPPVVTGFAITQLSQPVTGVALHCGSPPGCVPTGISYNRLAWNAFGACDDFNRVNLNTWNTATSGQMWTTSGGTAPNYFVDGRGNITIPTGDTTIRAALLPDSFADFNLLVTVSVDKLAVTQTSVIDVPLRAQDPLNNLYRVTLGFTPGGTVDTSLVRVVGGVGTTLASAASAFTYVADQKFHVYAEGRSSTIQVKIWTGDVDLPPGTWLLTGTDATYASGQFGVRARLVAGSTTVNPKFSFDDFSVTSAALAGGSIEIQRRDALVDWQTIMRATHPGCATAFSDFEARVGVPSEYRIRTCNVLDFCGPWVTGSATIPAPGVQVSGDASSLLIFTSNAAPLSSLAYVMQWEGQPVETFTFPEADEVQLLRLFGRDFFTAFHPLERGGEQFTRTILVNAAAIPLKSLANFRGLRDLAWANLNYVCVRDELGNRWLANVRVPEGSARLNRTVYLAQVQVVEVTDTPSPIDPTGSFT